MTRLRNTRESNIPSDWLYGVPPEDKDEFIKLWRNSTGILDPLKHILERYLEGLELDTKPDYSEPNWAYIRADKNGQVIALKRILNLLP